MQALQSAFGINGYSTDAPRMGAREKKRSEKEVVVVLGDDDEEEDVEDEKKSKIPRTST